jgi:murein DD-endopeptidase MepM/ murein hydrolase activator NlpD
MAGVAMIGCIAIVFGLNTSENAKPEPQQALEEAPLVPVVDGGAAAEPANLLTPEPEAPKAQPWNEQVVRNGDNLSLIFKRAGFDTQDVHRIVTESPDGSGLARIYPGQTIAFLGNESGELAAVRHVKSELETISYTLSANGYGSEVITRVPVTRQSNATGIITSSLFLAGQEAGLSHTTIMDMANIFGGVIDFVGDPRKGDTMHLLFEELYLDGNKFDDGEIIAASYANQGKTFTAYRYTDSAGKTGYFNTDGVSMRKAFLLAPVDFTRISSNFNPRRIHPIYKTARPHRGTDYAASTGTPVYAAGDGRVIKAGYNRATGNYVFIQHGEQFVTKYLHLHKRKVKQGARVSQSQVIGTVGSTGAATGPHLHYEFLMNGVHRNPRTIHKKLPKAKSLAASEMPRFRQAISEISEQLAALQQDTDNRLAMTESSEDKG